MFQVYAIYLGGLLNLPFQRFVPMRTVRQSVGVLFVGALPPSWTDLTWVAERVHGIDWLHVYKNLDSAAEQVQRRHPDILLLVPKLPGTVEYSLVHSIEEDLPTRTCVVVGCPLAPETLTEYLLLAISLGASACIPTDTPTEVLLRAAGLSSNGTIPIEYDLLRKVDLSPKVKDILWKTPPYQIPTPNMNPLTRRERDLLQAVAKGHSNQEIGELLHIQGQTVKNHVSSILRKTHARDRNQAAVNALRNGWLPLL